MEIKTAFLHVSCSWRTDRVYAHLQLIEAW